MYARKWLLHMCPSLCRADCQVMVPSVAIGVGKCLRDGVHGTNARRNRLQDHWSMQTMPPLFLPRTQAGRPRAKSLCCTAMVNVGAGSWAQLGSWTALK